ncbi:MAG TPA: gamma-glutamylcyclotransferase family protein [Candidatus Binatia bacterium]|nr:gamma-glutamylcyclotransferase family protein [Candidatus Binatia bacterium]
MTAPDGVWYFAYGSNMQRATFVGRRGIAPRRALAARVPGWQVVLDKPSLLTPGRAMANLVPADREEAFGVLYEITAADLAHVELTEGVLLGSYERRTIPVVPLAAASADGPLVAHTLASGERRAGIRPSRRYMALLIEGALEHGLPAAWIAHLRAVPADDDSAQELEMRALIDDTLRVLRRPD